VTGECFENSSLSAIIEALQSQRSIRYSLPGRIDGIVKYPHLLRRSIACDNTSISLFGTWRMIIPL
jgi:hypothetical protein